MKIATRVILGYVLLAGLLTAPLLFTVLTLRDVQRINSQLLPDAQRVTHDFLRFEQLCGTVEEFLKKAINDPKYLAAVSERIAECDDILEDHRGSMRSDKQRQEFERLERFWKTFREDFERGRPWPAPGEGSDLPPVLAEHFERIAVQVQSFNRATQEAVDAEIAAGRSESSRASIIAWTAASFALAVGFLSAFLIVRSIAQPLKSLTEGTREIAAGRFVHKLDTSRRDEFAELARDFNVMAGRLEELDQLKKDFISHVSHELKSPLASIRDTLELLREGIPGQLTDRQRRLVDASVQSCRRLSAMLGNLLDISRVEAGVLEYEMKPAKPAEILRDVLAEIELQARERGITTAARIADEPLVAVCDAGRIHQVLLNLVGNALKFSPHGSSVEIEIVPADREDLPSGAGPVPDPQGLVRISVADRGPGVPDPHKRSIFDKFHQVRGGRAASGQGSGLGLSISRAIVEAHGGFIWVQDRPGGGSIFTVLLPRSAAEAAGSSPPI